MTEDRKLELRQKAWAMARMAILDAAGGQLPGRSEEEDQYLREFLRGIAERTAPGEYREKDEYEDMLGEALANMKPLPEGWCEECQEIFNESHYHCAECGETCSSAGHPACLQANKND